MVAVLNVVPVIVYVNAVRKEKGRPFGRPFLRKLVFVLPPNQYPLSNSTPPSIIASKSANPWLHWNVFSDAAMAALQMTVAANIEKLFRIRSPVGVVALD